MGDIVKGLGGPVPVVNKTLASSSPKNPRIARPRGVDEKHAPTPEEGVRLVRAFHRIEDAPLRDAIVKIVEHLSFRVSLPSGG